MKFPRTLSLLFLALTISISSWADPAWEVRVEPSDLVKLENIKWHERESNWLFTTRLVTSVEKKLRPMTHIAFIAYDAEEEILWEYRKSIRKKDLESAGGGTDDLFVRVHIKEVPDETSVLSIEYLNQSKKSAEESKDKE